MRTMAYKLFSSLKSHPLITAFSVLLLFTLPIFNLLMFFWPLIVSTALGVLAVVSFGRPSDKCTMPIVECGTVGHPDIIAFPPCEEKISNLLMVGNQEVTWLEWLHNEDTQKLCAHELQPAVWDAHGCDVSSMASEASVNAPASRAEDKLSVYANGSTCKDEAIDDTSLQAKDKGRLYGCGLRGEDESPVSALVLAEENETSSLVLDGSRGMAIVLEDVNRDETKMNAPILTAEDETNLDSTGEDQMCRFGWTGEDETAKNAIKCKGIAFTVNEKSNTRAPACAEGDEGQIGVEGLRLTGGGGNECKTTQGLLDSTIHTKNDVDGYASAGEDEVVGTVEALVLEATLECNVMTHSLASTTDSEIVMNKCVSASGVGGKTSLHATLETKNGLEALEFPSPTEALSYISEPKIAHTHEQDVPDLPSSNKTKVHEMQHVDEQDEEERGSKQVITQGPHWDVSDGEEDQSSLRFSFFHNRSKA